MLKYFVDNYLYRKEIKFGKGKKVNTNLYIFARNVVNRLFKDKKISDSMKKTIIIKYLDYAFKRAKRENSIFANTMVDAFKEYKIQEDSIEELKRVSNSNFNNPHK